MALFLSEPSASEPVVAWRWVNGRVEVARDPIAGETALALVYNGRPHVVMMVTPRDIEEFVLGFSLSEAIIRDPAELAGVRTRVLADGIEADITIAAERFRELDRKQRNLTGRIGCGLCGARTLAQAVRHPRPVGRHARLAASALRHALEQLAGRQPLHAETGAVHAAAWVDDSGGIPIVREDVGRHNALDKLIGAMVREGVDPRRGAVLITSRASHEMIQKAAAIGIEIVCAISAPTTLAVRLAGETGMTLVAFARGDRHTVYAHPERIAPHEERVAV